MPESKILVIVEEELYQPVPDWLNKCFLEKALRRYWKTTDINVTSFHIGPATAKGENFASCMFRVRAVYDTENEVNLRSVSVYFSDSNRLFSISESDRGKFYCENCIR